MKKNLTIWTIIFLVVLYTNNLLGQQLLWTSLEGFENSKYLPIEKVKTRVFEYFKTFEYYKDNTGYSLENFLKNNNLKNLNLERIKTNMEEKKIKTFVFCIKTNSGNGAINSVYFIRKDSFDGYSFSDGYLIGGENKNIHYEKNWKNISNTIDEILELSEENLTDINLENKLEEKEVQIFTAVEEMAEFPGGAVGFAKYLNANLIYPEEGRKDNVNGRVYVQFVVNTDGSLEDIKILKSLGYGFDLEAIRLIQNSPKWNPGKSSGRAVRSRFTASISFYPPPPTTSKPKKPQHCC